MIQLGAIDETFKIDSPGSNYFMCGGTVDGSGIAKGIILEAGRETSVRHITITNVTQGLEIAYNSAYGSNDCDFEFLKIEGCNAPGSIGVFVNGLDNTLSNLEISGFEIGVKLSQPGNFMRNIHAKYIPSDELNYHDSIGFYDACGSNWMDEFHAEDFMVGYRIADRALDRLSRCAVSWGKATVEKQIAIMTEGMFNSFVSDFKAEFFGGTENVFLSLAAEGGKGVIENPIFDDNKVGDSSYTKYLVGDVVEIGGA